MSGLKFVALTATELLAFKTHIFYGYWSRDPRNAQAVFYPFLTFTVGGHQETSFEL